MGASQQVLASLAAASGGTSYTLVHDSVTSQTGTWPFGYAVDGSRRYAGLNHWSDASARKIGRITFKLSLENGSISGKTFVAKIWSLTGNNLNAVLATSTGVTGSNAWSTTLVDFDFSSPFTTTGSTGYGITIDMGGDDGTNNAMGYHTTPQVAVGNLTRWESTGVENETFSAYNMQLKIYTVP